MGRLKLVVKEMICVCSMSQRLKNHMKDMSHAHLKESKLIPELSVKPSALRQKRPVDIRRKYFQ